MSEDRITISPREVCERLGITRKTLRRWWNAGLFPTPMRIGPKLLFWDAATFRKWCREQRPLDAVDRPEGEV